MGNMTRDEILLRLKAAEGDLRSQGVAHAALFGSIARGEDTRQSDIDIMVEIAPEARVGAFAYTGIVQSVEALFAAEVDVSNRIALKPHVRQSAERDAIYAF